MTNEQQVTELRTMIEGLRIVLADNPQHLKAFNHLLYAMSECFSINAEYTIDNSIPSEESRRLEPIETLMHSIYNLSRLILNRDNLPACMWDDNDLKYLNSLSLDDYCDEMSKRMNPINK